MSTHRLESLMTRTKFGIKPGLELTRSLLEALGSPERAFLCVHVAGTNGKGSVCAMIESVLRHAGLRTGLFTSPHLVRVHERIRISGEPVSDAALESSLDAVADAEKGLTRPATFFETLTAAAFWAFREAGVQVAVVETGLGGRLDSTNVVEPLVSVITRVDYDHQAFLGDTLEAIAGEKAGIIKPGRPVVLGAQTPTAEEVLLRRARETNSRCRRTEERVGLSDRRVSLEGQRVRVSTQDREIGRIRIPLLGAVQMENLATAVAALEEIAALLGTEWHPDLFREGLAATQWAARGQVMSQHPPILLDVAHNPGGARGLRGMIEEVISRSARGVWVWSALRDKPAEKFLRILKPRMAECWCVELRTPRTRSAEELVSVAESLGISAKAMTLDAARADLPVRAAELDFGCIAGSVYLAGEWLAERKPDPGEG